AWLDAQPRLFPPDAPASGDALADLAWTASVGRAHFAHRAALPFRNAASLRTVLQEVAGAPDAPDAPDSRAPSKIAFVYTGQGSQWPGMGQALYETEPVFRAVLDRCDEVLRQARGASLLDVMFGRPGAPGGLDDPAWTQPVMYALECALTALWDSVGVRPDVVMGHSLGEIAAAQAAGAFSLEDGLRFAAARGELMAALPVPGAMAALFDSPEEADAAVREWNAASGGPELSVAAYNGAHQVVSGEAQEVERLAQRFESQGVRVSRLRSGAGYHSALVEPALDGLAAAAQTIPAAPPALPLVSNVTGRAMEPGAAHDAAYWRKHARQPVAFSRSVQTLAEMGVDAVIEIGPHAVLGPMAELA
ncbi:MAG: acyltransferase domain-containing protein, partial [Chloroflexota bacterium]|nr:acyltransferase domain-containing protein [Chloroflexota bacterium]